ncbi:PAS domain-containing sensor histidine kinase [Methylobacterium sp. 17Sr1-1]|uniref:hybrid sensor histidine kinase/response regulator n=1 Tax=Methylobacterium sp. 17Sr1-1 TaxID=2202826 RepID=UPI000D700C78|nr:PAS domain-containing sensor histidine kinase [Methylobacterium sp. 17Sr1-1]AWN55321.1 hybrid sensor histidine kinase/response regulator [Methylobacterium sp. 17Sr1-1]
MDAEVRSTLPRLSVTAPESVTHAHDWSATPLGPPQTWPVALKTLCDVIDGSAQPMFVVWGVQRILIYNQPYAAILADKHPEACGRPFLDVWSEIAQDLIPLVERAYAGEAVQMDDITLVIRRNGVAKQAHFSFSYTPVRSEEGHVAGFFCACLETTAQVLAERKRQVVTDRVRAALAIKTVGILHWGPTFGLTEVNEAFLTMTGFSEEEALGKTWQELTPVEFWPASERAVGQVLTLGEAVPYEKQYYRKDGSRWWGLFAPRKVEDGVIEFVLDVTERKEAEERLREREQRLQLILDSAIDYAILTLDPERRVTSWSPGAARTFGYEAQEILGKSGDVLFTPEDRQAGAPEEEAATARRNGYAPDVRWHRRKDGSHVFVSGSNNVLRDPSGVEIGFLKVARDETERRRAEEEVRETEERYRLAARATNDAIWDWNLATNHIRWNEAVETLFGYRPEEVAPSGAWWTAKLHSDDRARVVAGITAAIDGKTDTWTAQYRFERRDGTYAEILDRGTVLRDRCGRAVRMVGAMHDLTPHKQAETMLRQLNETLEHRVVQEVASRLKTEDALRQSQKLEAIGQLTGGVAHDFNNLLTVIRGAAQMLCRPALSEERRQRYAEAISETADRAAKLTSQLLAFSRRQALKPEVFNVGQRIEAVVEMLRTVVGSRVELTTDTECDICYVEADPSQFETALVNMAVNARDAMDGVGQLTITIEPTKAVPGIRGHKAAEGDFVAVYVTDTGAGIPAEKLAQIFEPFFTTKEIGKGTGLGLSQVYGFAKQSGGDVAVESALGKGTTFKVYLPRVPASVAEAALESAASDEARGHGHVLVVEDNEQVGQFSTQLLSELGFETTWAPNAETALRFLEEHPRRYAAVFSDVVMPGMNGVELGKEVRRRQPELPVVLTSGYSHVLAQEGSHGFELLHKPYAVEDLTRVLRSAIRQRAT